MNNKGVEQGDVEKCLQLCKDYLSGNWTQMTAQEIELKRMTGGVNNKVFYCRIREGDNSYTCPQEVIVRLYDKHDFELLEQSRLRDTVLALIFSENELGPKVYGVFEEGQILQFYKHRPFKQEEQKNSKLSKIVLKTLAKIHSLDVPLKRSPQMFELMVEAYESASRKFTLLKEIDEYECETLKKFNIRTEMDWLKNLIQKVDSPVVFTHNDFRGDNLFITEPNDDLVVIDFDYSGYGYRGYDFFALMREWGRQPTDPKPMNGLPFDNSMIRPLIEIYVEECVRIHGKSYSENPINSVDHILKEIQIFVLFVDLFGTVGCIKNDEKDRGLPFSRKQCMQMADKGFAKYLDTKQVLKDNELFD